MVVTSKMPENKQFLSPASVSVLNSVENIPRYSNSKICLFGKPDGAFTEKLLSEHFSSEKQRMLERWGFDILSEKIISPKKLETRTRRKKVQKQILADKENINILDESDRKLLDVEEAVLEKLDNSIKKTSLKMTTDRQRLRKARQSQVTDYWRSRKFSESSSCSDKEN